jgi:hypothetical protein
MWPTLGNVQSYRYVAHGNSYTLKGFIWQHDLLFRVLVYNEAGAKVAHFSERWDGMDFDAKYRRVLDRLFSQACAHVDQHPGGLPQKESEVEPSLQAIFREGKVAR